MRIHLLIIEAENRFQLNLAQRLKRDDFKIIELTGQAPVETTVVREKIDVVLLGIDGLGRDGLEMIRRIKTARPLAEIIMINDSGQMDLSMEGMKLGAFDDFIIPFDIDSLVTRIKEAGRREHHANGSEASLQARGGKKL